MERKFLNKNNSVKVCYKDACVQAHGKNASLITEAVKAFFVLAGIAVVIKAVK